MAREQREKRPFPQHHEEVVIDLYGDSRGDQTVLFVPVTPVNGQEHNELIGKIQSVFPSLTKPDVFWLMDTMSDMYRDRFILSHIRKPLQDAE